MQKKKLIKEPTPKDKKEFVHRLRKLQAKMAAQARKMGIHNDQDVFDRVS